MEKQKIKVEKGMRKKNCKYLQRQKNSLLLG